MSDNSEHESKRPLSLGQPRGRIELRKPIETGQVRQSFPHGRSKTVTVEVRKKRSLAPGQSETPPEFKEAPPAAPKPQATPAPRSNTARPAKSDQTPPRRPISIPRGLTAEERA
ncbi:MAG TPA: translation initiation factor IF-2 associated domain-containing protein, partial [Stellaceae bacterium]|nr:translation initiation factor IF-2 associated domain-containing protein [Stellaceae bacterium]